MSYTKNVWRDLETGGTPITAEKLNHIEEGIEDLDQFRDSISHSRGVLLSGGCCYDRVGGLVIIHLFNCSTGTGGAQRTIGTLPEGYRPSKAIEGSSNLGAINKVFANQQSNFVRVYTDGRIVLDKFGSESMDFTGQVMFAI